MKLITEEVRDVKYINEEKNGSKSLYIQGPFLVSGEPNKNNRIYDPSIMEREVKRYTKEYIDENRAFGEFGHPSDPGMHLDRVCMLTKSLIREGNMWYGKAMILDTPTGNIAKGIINGGGVLGVSSRGMGSLKEMNGINYVQDDFYLATAADIVADPSAPGAFVQGIMEGKEWVWDNGLVKEVNIVEYYDTIKKAKTKQLEEIQLRIFENFLSKL